MHKKPAMVEEEGFHGYVPTTNDPGYSLLIFATAFSLFSYAIVPFLSFLGRKYEASRSARPSQRRSKLGGRTQSGNQDGAQLSQSGRHNRSEEAASSSNAHGKANSSMSGSKRGSRIQLVLDKVIKYLSMEFALMCTF